ncbi:MAG: hypothetical protein WBQ94_26260 [Terracidiphilus sp.]
MRIGAVALFLSAGTTALSQLAAPVPSSPEKPGLTPPNGFLSQKEFSKGPPAWQIAPGGSLKMVVPPGTGSLRPGSAQVDPEMVVHPPPSSIGNQPPGIAVSQNHYPGLELLPIEQAKANGGPVPSRWPNLKMQQIPIIWPKFEIKPAENGTATKTQAPQK